MHVCFARCATQGHIKVHDKKCELFADLGRLDGIQGFISYRNRCSFFILLISHLLMRDLAYTILRLPYDSEYDLIGSRGFVFLKYQPLKIIANTELSFSIRCHSCFSIKILNILKTYTSIFFWLA